ncbi:DNA mismatch repair endonuclease MutL [Candidatus Woesebacteria bacterium]|nr:DNA mismatch repair endonuclease MutL [Candidatus Woesebacteria bacterium]
MIQKLNQELITQIAAGQVIERPASILKELIENSLDADASVITIRLEDGGKTSIVVSDNGCGVAASEVSLAFERHTTSKISEFADLQNIKSLGFRGEALHSISAVAEVFFISKTADSPIGVYLHKKDASSCTTGQRAHTQGTKITITNLFSAVPARKKFLRTAAIELAACLDVIVQSALAQPAVTFRVFIDGKLEYDLPPGDLLTRIQQLALVSHAEHLLPLHGEQDTITISGYIGVPQVGFEEGKKQYYFINGRAVSFIQAAKILKRAYGTLLESRKQPLAILNIAVPPAFVDVNIHPTKHVVKLSVQNEVLTVLQETVKKILTDSLLNYKLTEQLFFKDSKHMDIALAQQLTDTALPWHPAQLSGMADVLQLHRLYLVAESSEGLLIIDQHAAHERILYEEYLLKFNENKKKHVLKKAVCIQLNPVEHAEKEKILEGCLQLGLEVSCDAKVLNITALPFSIEEQHVKSFVHELINSILADTSEDVPNLVHTTCAFLACRHAIKAGDPLTMVERRNLIKKLFQTTGNYTCPHGRPVYITATENELEHWFHRAL